MRKRRRSTCSAPGADGECGPVRSGDDPRSNCPDDGAPSCDRDGTCDGAGQCAIYADATPCGATSCVGLAVTGFLCDGRGTCVSRSNVACGDYACAGSACNTTCAGDSDCAPTAYCSGAECRPKSSAAQPCTTGAECGSGFCTDGLCCDRICQGQCEACDVPSAEGRCTPVVGVPRGARPSCPTGTAADPCGARICDGQTVTTCSGFVGSEVPCRTASCTAGVATLAASCDGKGACPAEQTSRCEPFVCDGTTCGSSPCTSDADRADEFRCVQGDCVAVEAAACAADGRTLVSPDGASTDCAPYVCEGSACRTACQRSDQCVLGFVCDPSLKACVSEAGGGGASGEDGSCACRGAGVTRGVGQVGFAVLALALAAIRRRRRRVHLVDPGAVPSGVRG